jgi:hypothetical protein
MNKHINFEDTLFILNARLRLIRDILNLDADPNLFLRRSLDDLEFIDQVLAGLLANLIANPRLLDRELELDNLSDLEWQYSQLLTEFSGDSSPFSAAGFPETRERIPRLRSNSADRRKTIDESFVSAGQGHAEPVVSSVELNELLRGM